MKFPTLPLFVSRTRLRVLCLSVASAVVLLLAPTAYAVNFTDNFDTYANNAPMNGVNGWRQVGVIGYKASNNRSVTSPNSLTGNGTNPAILAQFFATTTSVGYVSSSMWGEDQNAGLFLFAGGQVDADPSGSFSFSYGTGGNTLNINSGMSNCSWSAVDISDTPHWSFVQLYWAYDGVSYSLNPIVEGVSQGEKTGCTPTVGAFVASGYYINFNTGTNYSFDNFNLQTDDDFNSTPLTSRVIEVLNPTYGTTTASTTINVRYTYHNADGYDGAKIFLRHQLKGTVYTYYDFFDSTLIIDGTATKTIELLDFGAYTMQINLCFLPTIGAPDCMSTGGGTSLFYAVASDGGIQTVITTGYADYVTYPATSCAINLNPFASSTFNFNDCVGYLVSPSTTTLARFETLTVEDRFPFVYFYQIPQLVSYLFQTTTDNSSAGLTVTVGAWTWTFINQQMIADADITPFMRLVITMGLYIVAGLTCYRKIIRWHDKVTTS